MTNNQCPMFSESITGLCLAYDYLVWSSWEEACWPGSRPSRETHVLGLLLRWDLRWFSQADA